MHATKQNSKENNKRTIHIRSKHWHNVQNEQVGRCLAELCIKFVAISSIQQEIACKTPTVLRSELLGNAFFIDECSASDEASFFCKIQFIAQRHSVL